MGKRVRAAFWGKSALSAFKETIRRGLEEYLQGLKGPIKNLTPAEALWQPTICTSHIAWLVWHMARVEDR